MFGTRAALLPLFLTFLIYPLVAWFALSRRRAGKGSALFSIVNILGAYAACVCSFAGFPANGIYAMPRLCEVTAVAFLFYVFLLAVNYWLLRSGAKASQLWVALIFIYPLILLIVIKYVPQVQPLFSGALRPIGIPQFSILFVGLSYITFRLIHLAQEVRNELVPMPSLLEYLSFAFFVPTLTTGPINPYSNYLRSLENLDRERTPILRSMLRLIVGLTKYIFLSTLLSQLTYAGLLRDGHPHARVDLLIAFFAYTLFLYCNFSGFCDMVIGVSGLLGIEVMENFNQPFLARNLQEFWNRWHISLSTWLRDMMFSPMVKMLARKFGPQFTPHAIAISIMSVFIVIGVWHGVGTNYAVFGVIEGIGVISVHYYTLFIKKRLGKTGFIKYRDNPIIRAVSTAMTFTYFSFSLFFFANSWSQIQQIFKVLI